MNGPMISYVVSVDDGILGFSWTDRSVLDAVHAARLAGFDVIEFHWPCEIGPGALKAVLGAEYLPNVDTATLGW